VQSDHTLFAPRPIEHHRPRSQCSADRTRTAPRSTQPSSPPPPHASRAIKPLRSRFQRKRNRPRRHPPSPAKSLPSRVQMNSIAVVLRPSRSRTRIARTAKLNLPAPSVVAPPPSAISSRPPSSGKWRPSLFPRPMSFPRSNSSRQRIVRQQHHRQTFRYADVSASAQRDFSSTAGISAMPAGPHILHQCHPTPPSVGSSNQPRRLTSGNRHHQSTVIPPPPSVQIARNFRRKRIGPGISPAPTIEP